MKKLVSMLLVLAMLVTVFAGLAVTASAADTVLSVYTQAGEAGEKTLAKSYTAEELKKLAETKADGYGYQYFKKGEQAVVATEYVTLDTLLTDADVTFADGDSLSFVCGTTEADYAAESAAGKRMPSGVTELIIVSAAKAEEKPAEEKPAEDKTGFADVKTSDWFHADVAYVVENKLMTGTSDTTFNPAGSTTRAMVVTTLYRMAGSPEVTGKTAFTDVAAGSYYEKAVIWAAENSVASGTSATTFEPNKAVTREQLAQFLFKYAQYNGLSAVTLAENLSSFADNDAISAYAIPALQWAVGQGFLNGADGKLLPAGTATRCQFAAILHRFCAAQTAA